MGLGLGLECREAVAFWGGFSIQGGLRLQGSSVCPKSRGFSIQGLDCRVKILGLRFTWSSQMFLLVAKYNITVYYSHAGLSISSRSKYALLFILQGFRG